MTDVRTAVVTGACGFLGSRIASALAGEGYRVVGLDRTVERAPVGIACRAMALPSDDLYDLLVAEQPEVFVHAAGPASVGDSVTDPLADFRGSVDVHAHVLDTIRRAAPGARFVTLSSAAVYGDPASLPVGESAVLAPISPYGHHKVMCEALLREYASVYGIKTCALRIFSAYGAGLRRQLLWDVCEKAASGLVQLGGSGEQTRDFVHADDVAAAVLALLGGAAFTGEVYNCASGVETSIRDLAEQLSARIDPDVAVTFSGVDRPGDPMRWVADIDAIRALGFEPRVTLDNGLAEYAAWYLSERA